MLGDWCAVDVVGADGAVIRLALVQLDPDRLDLDATHERVAAVVRTGVSHLEPGLICSALKLRGRVLGAMTVGVEPGSPRRYGPSDLELTEDLGRRAAMTMENARLYREALGRR